MFHFFYRVTLALFFITLGYLCIGKAIGGFRYDPMAGLFTYPDGSPCPMPCLFGIEPGKTSFQNAEIFIQTHPMTSNLRLFEGDFTGVPTGPWGNLFRSETGSILFMGQADNHAISLQVYEGVIDSDIPFGSRVIVRALCLRSVFNNATVELPHITSELAAMWRRTSFLQMLTTLGSPESFSNPTIGSTDVWSSRRLESFYFDDHLVITHVSDSDGYYTLDFTHTFFDSMCLYSDPANGPARFYTGYHGRVGAVVPWLGMYASREDYATWMDEHPATEEIWSMP